MDNVEFKNINGHCEVYIDGEFQFSADTEKEARKDYEKDLQQHKINV